MFQTPVFVFQALQPLCLIHFQATVLALPRVDRRLADTTLTRQIRHLVACLVLLQNADDLLFAESAFLHLRILLRRFLRRG